MEGGGGGYKISLSLESENINEEKGEKKSMISEPWRTVQI